MSTMLALARESLLKSMFAAAALCAGLAGPAAQAFESVYTSATENCRDITDPHERDRASSSRCPGPAGYSVKFFDEGNVVGAAFGPTGHEKDLGGLQWPGGVDARKIEWRMLDGRPVAAIFRLSRMNPETSAMTPQLAVVKITSAGACLIDLVDARAADANETARRIADQRATTHVCRR